MQTIGPFQTTPSSAEVRPLGMPAVASGVVLEVALAVVLGVRGSPASAGTSTVTAAASEEVEEVEWEVATTVQPA